MAQTQVVNTTKIVEPLKERSNMVKARKDAHLSQKDVSQKMNVDIKSVNNWEKARTDPRHYQIDELREVIGFAGTDKELLQVFTVEESNQEPCHQEAVHDTRNSSDHTFVIHIPRSDRGFKEFMELFRRQFIGALVKITGVKLFDHVTLALVSSPTVEPEEYLSLVEASMGTWWQWYYQGNYHELEKTLLKRVPVLTRLATTISPHQGTAASLAVEAIIIQILLATRNLQFGERERHCAEAVRFGALSGNRDILTTALGWQGNTYTLCYRQPQRAIPILSDTLSGLNSDTSQLTRSAMYSNLSIAHAQVGDEAKARDYIEMAHVSMPTHPKLDPFYPCIRWNHSELEAREGKVYLYLAEHFPDSSYAEKAYEAFKQSTNKQAISKSILGATLIDKADAARAMGKMDHCVDGLREGLDIGVEIKHIRRIIEADEVMG